MGMGALAVVAPAVEVVDAVQMALPGFHDDLRPDRCWMEISRALCC